MFRPCIDLHEGKVKQIVGGTLGEAGLRTNFVSEKPAAWFAELYRHDGLKGGHVIQLGAGNDAEARSALAAYPGGLHVGGGVNAQNARGWLDAGASHVIVTSWVFREGRVDWNRLEELVKAIGRAKLVLDLSCRKRGEKYFVVTDRWQEFTELGSPPKRSGNLRTIARNFSFTPWTWKACAAASMASSCKSSASGPPFHSLTRAAQTRWPIWRRPRGSAAAAWISRLARLWIFSAAVA
jgi:phosphoribosylformimino-5-aminoimidazole carboxamide ribotide isomerase